MRKKKNVTTTKKQEKISLQTRHCTTPLQTRQTTIRAYVDQRDMWQNVMEAAERRKGTDPSASSTPQPNGDVHQWVIHNICQLSMDHSDEVLTA